MLQRIWKKLFGCDCCELSGQCLTFKDLALAICKKEAGKKEQDIAQIRETLSVVLDLMADHIENHCEKCLLEFIRNRGRKQ